MGAAKCRSVPFFTGPNASFGSRAFKFTTELFGKVWRAVFDRGSLLSHSFSVTLFFRNDELTVLRLEGLSDFNVSK